MADKATDHPRSAASSNDTTTVSSIEAIVEDATDDLADRVHQQIQSRPWFRRVAQVGWIAKGIVYGSLGWAAIEISLAKSAPDEAEYTGIVASLAEGSFTRILLAIIAVGLVFYIVFRLVSVALIDEVDADAWAHRVAYLASAFTYITVAWAAAFAVISGTSDSGESSIERYSVTLLGSGLGRVALAVGGTAALAVAIYFVFKGITRRFMSQIDDTDLGATERRMIEYSGAIGWVGRGATVAVVAAFITWAAIDADPGDVRGIDSSMHRVANDKFGQVVVMALGIGLLIYAGYCVLTARRRRMAWDNNPEPSVDYQPHSTATSNRSNS